MGRSFIARTTLLDKYIENPPNAVDQSLLLDVLIKAIESDIGLRRYFFKRGPSSKWAEILWEKGFFSTPPEPEITSTGTRFPWWDVQYYLIQVAGDVPEVVKDYVQHLSAHPLYRIKAIESVYKLESQDAVGLVPTIVSWLQDPDVTDWLVNNWHATELIENITKLISNLTEGGFLEQALALFEQTLMPVRPSHIQKIEDYVLNHEAISLFEEHHRTSQLRTLHELLVRHIELNDLVELYERQLLLTLTVEADIMSMDDLAKLYWGRPSIEVSLQNSLTNFKDDLLDLLRDSAELLLEKDTLTLARLVRKYLTSDISIFRRLGIHLLTCSPNTLSDLVQEALVDERNLGDPTIHHEYFRLLERGPAVLDVKDTKKLIELVTAGPSAVLLENIEDRWQRFQPDMSLEDFVTGHRDLWIRDRLLMLAAYLDEQQHLFLTALLEKYGLPDHPSYLSWHGEAFTVTDISPFSENELGELTPERLVSFLASWEEPANQQVEPQMVTWNGLATEVSNLILNDLDTYWLVLPELLQINPIVPYRILSNWRTDEPHPGLDWGRTLALLETISEIIPNITEWNHVKMELLSVVQKGLERQEEYISAEILSRLKDLILFYIDDPDPLNEEIPQPFGRSYDPHLMALNHTRPVALDSLVTYAYIRALQIYKGPYTSGNQAVGPSMLEPDVQQILTSKLNRNYESSELVHSIFGKRLATLFWLDSKWVTDHIAQIFPQEDNGQSRRLYIVAWNSYTAFTRQFYIPLFQVIRNEYDKALDYIAEGYITEAYGSEKGLGIHLIWEYLLDDYTLFTEEARNHSLLARFFQVSNPNARGDAIFFLKRVLEDPNNLVKYSNRVRELWEWRVREASRLNFPEDFSREMLEFSRFPSLLQGNIGTEFIWSLLEGMVPYFSNPVFTQSAWHNIYEFLSHNATSSPQKVVKFLALLVEESQGFDMDLSRNKTEVCELLGITVRNPDSRTTTLNLIDQIIYYGEIPCLRQIFESYVSGKS